MYGLMSARQQLQSMSTHPQAKHGLTSQGGGGGAGGLSGWGGVINSWVAEQGCKVDGEGGKGRVGQRKYEAGR